MENQKKIVLTTLNGKMHVSKNVIKGYELNSDGMPMNVFFASGMAWSIEPDEENMKQLESLNL